MAAAGYLRLILPLLPLLCPGLQPPVEAAEQVALVEVFVEQRPGVSALLQGEVVESSPGSWSSEHRDEEGEELQGELVLVGGSNYYTNIQLNIYKKRKEHLG